MVWVALLYSAISSKCATKNTIRCRLLESSWSQKFFGRSSAIEFKYRGICLRPAYIYSTKPIPPYGVEKRGLRFLSLSLAVLGTAIRSWALAVCGGELLHLSSLGNRRSASVSVDMCFFLLVWFLKKASCPSVLTRATLSKGVGASATTARIANTPITQCEKTKSEKLCWLADGLGGFHCWHGADHNHLG